MDKNLNGDENMAGYLYYSTCIDTCMCMDIIMVYDYFYKKLYDMSMIIYI